MKLLDLKDEAFLRLAREEDNCSISAGTIDAVFQKRETAPKASAPVERASSPSSQAGGPRPCSS
jgi:hypothetical protein